MDPEIKKALEELRGLIGKNVEVLPRVEAIEKAAQERGAETKELRGLIDGLKQELVARDALIKELQQQARVAAAQRDPVRDRRRALEILGGQVRILLARANGAEIPAQFRGEAALVEEHQRATLYAGGVTGSYLVPTLLEAGSIIDTLEEVSDLLSRVEFIPGLPGNVNIPTITGRPTLQPTRATVDTGMTQSDPTFGLVQLQPAEAYTYFPVDNRLLQMSAVALGSLCTNLIRDAIVQGICTWLLTGDGTSTYNSITGILNEATYVVAMGAGKTSFGDVDKVSLQKALVYLLKRGRARGAWLMSLYVQGLIEELDRTGKVPVISYAQNGDVRCMQRPIVIDEGMPDEADNNKDTGFIGVGDLGTYIVGLVGGIQIATSTEYRFGYNQTAFRGVINLDIERKPVKTFALLKTAAA